MNEKLLYDRRCNVALHGVRKDENGNDGEVITLDLSEFRIRFEVRMSENASPNHASIRIYNLSPQTVHDIIWNGSIEFREVVLQAGYNSVYGVIFEGVIVQFQKGRENSLNTYLDVLASCSDEEWNWGEMSQTVSRGATKEQIVEAAARQTGFEVSAEAGDFGGAVKPRAKVLWGYGRYAFRKYAAARKKSYQIAKNGVIEFFDEEGYKKNEVVELTSRTGLIGIPQQTDSGIVCRCLINPLLDIGSLVHINQASINETLSSRQYEIRANGGKIRGQQRHDAYGELVFPVDVTSDGIYRLYIVEHIGDNRGGQWYSELTALAVSPDTLKTLDLGKQS